jgi:hypothetical protein
MRLFLILMKDRGTAAESLEHSADGTRAYFIRIVSFYLSLGLTGSHWVFHLQVFRLKACLNFPSPPACYIPHLSHTPCFVCPNNIGKAQKL